MSRNLSRRRIASGFDRKAIVAAKSRAFLEAVRYEAGVVAL